MYSGIAWVLGPGSAAHGVRVIRWDDCVSSAEAVRRFVRVERIDAYIEVLQYNAR